MIKVGEKFVFEQHEIDLRRDLVQRSIDIMVDPARFKNFTEEFNKFLECFEGENAGKKFRFASTEADPKWMTWEEQAIFNVFDDPEQIPYKEPKFKIEI